AADKPVISLTSSRTLSCGTNRQQRSTSRACASGTASRKKRHNGSPERCSSPKKLRSALSDADCLFQTRQNSMGRVSTWFGAASTSLRRENVRTLHRRTVSGTHHSAEFFDTIPPHPLPCRGFTLFSPPYMPTIIAVANQKGGVA